MWRNQSLIIAKECMQASMLSHSFKRVLCNDVQHGCLKHLTFLKSKDGFFHRGILQQSMSTYADLPAKIKKTDILKNSVKESDKKCIENQGKSEACLDIDIEPMIKVVSNESFKSNSSPDIIPGKGPPPEPPIDCCMTGCVNCVWIQYAEELRDYYAADGNERARKEIEKIENPSLKAFIKLELGL